MHDIRLFVCDVGGMWSRGAIKKWKLVQDRTGQGFGVPRQTWIVVRPVEYGKMKFCTLVAKISEAVQQAMQ